jgi:hypothetical protein
MRRFCNFRCPTPEDKDWAGWDEVVVKACEGRFDWAKKLLRVQDVGELASKTGACISDEEAAAAAAIVIGRPLYGALQSAVHSRLDAVEDELAEQGINRAEPANLASADADFGGIDFLKFSVPGSLLELKNKYVHEGKSRHSGQ